MRVLLVHNPQAGDQDLSADELVAAVRAAGHEPVYRSTEQARAFDVLEHPADLVVAAGGDGTVRKVAIRLVGRKIPMTILPLGTANNIAGTLGLTAAPRRLIAGWASARRQAFDVGLVKKAVGGEQRFIEAVGLGLFPHAVAAIEAQKRAGHYASIPARDELERDLAALKDLLAGFPAGHRQVVIDGEDCSGRYLLVEVMNTRQIGPNVPLAARADPGDGRLDVVLVGDADRAGLAAYLAGRLEGPQPPPELPVRSGRRVQIYPEGVREVHLDDEVWSEEKTGRHRRAPADPLMDVTLEPGALEFLVPG